MATPSLLLSLGLTLASTAAAPSAPQDPRPGGEGAAIEQASAEQEPAEDKAPPPPRSPEQWRERVAELARAVENGEVEPEVVDEVYAELDRVLRGALDSHVGVFRRARRTSDPVPASREEGAAEQLEMGETVADLYASIATLYRARLELLRFVTPELHAELTGNRVTGVRELSLEIDFVRRTLHYQRTAIPDGALQVTRNLRTAPVPTILGLLIVIGALVAFRVWRRWAIHGIPRLLELTRRAWRHHPAAAPFGELLRYFERVRRPLEWIALFLVVFSLVDVPELHELEGTLRIVAFWILLAWLSVSLADAFASRADTRSGREERNKARLRSLRIVAAWGVVLGLGLQLTAHLAGRGTMHAWIWHLFELLAIPVAVLLLLIWRPEIRRRLEREARFSAWVAKLLERRGRAGALIATLGGLAYLFVLGIRRVGLRLVRRSALGRTLVAEAVRQSMTRANEEGTEEGPLPELDADLRKRWLRGEALVEAAVADELAEMLEMLERGWNSVVLVGERGAGKSVFLNCLAEQLEGRVLVVSCPHGGARAAYAALCRALGVAEDSEPEAVDEVIRSQNVTVIAWDDVHRLCRPVLGGQAELDDLVERCRPWQDLPNIATVDSAAWEYLGRMREGTVTGASTVMLSAWTEGQIGELLESRAREVGMELDYARLRFPRLLLEQDFESPEQGLHASYRRILWGEADGNPEVALRLVVDHLVEKDNGDALLLLPHSPAASELEGTTLVELLVLRFIAQTDGATSEELVAGLRYPDGVVENALGAAEMRGLLEENHGRYRIAWRWYRTVTRVLSRRNMLGAARQKSERSPPDSAPMRHRPVSNATGGRYR